MRLEFDLDVQVARRGARPTGPIGRLRTLAREADRLSGQNAFRYLHVQHALANREVSLGIDLGHAQREAAGASRERGVQIEQIGRASCRERV